mmetsp:Transcript_22121/g.47919  ORF Transcript_22121/g.47919 Transcript_22121/m.47919 type:complete len:202 (+) Transcript_22121:1266-1871(+)
MYPSFDEITGRPARGMNSRCGCFVFCGLQCCCCCCCCRCGGYDWTNLSLHIGWFVFFSCLVDGCVLAPPSPPYGFNPPSVPLPSFDSAARSGSSSKNASGTLQMASSSSDRTHSSQNSNTCCGVKENKSSYTSQFPVLTHRSAQYRWGSRSARARSLRYCRIIVMSSVSKKLGSWSCACNVCNMTSRFCSIQSRSKSSWCC